MYEQRPKKKKIETIPFLLWFNITIFLKVTNFDTIKLHYNDHYQRRLQVIHVYNEHNNDVVLVPNEYLFCEYSRL
jgi:hypothetical protein